MHGRVTWLGRGLLAVLVLAAAGLWALARDPTAERAYAGGLESIRQAGTVRLGYANEAPYGYRDTATGRITGEAPEVARVVLRRLGIERIEAVVTEFGALIPGLGAGRFDIIAAGMYITPARCSRIAFSEPTYRIGEAFAVRAGNPLALHSFEDVARRPSATLGVVGGAVEHTYARAVGIPAARLAVFPDNISALTALRAGRIDAWAATRLTTLDLLRKANTAQIELAEPFSDPVIDGRTTVGYGAFGFRLRDRDLLAAFNRELDDFIGSDEHLRLTARFGITRDTLPGEVTTRELCGRT